jgi:DNA polymerase-3 subunit epsilon
MLIARRLYQEAPNHKLGGLVEFKQIENDGTFHRALADSEMTAKLWLKMLEDMHDSYSIADPSFRLMQHISQKTKSGVKDFLNSL